MRKGRQANGTQCVKQLELSPTGALWEAAQNTDLNTVQLRSEQLECLSTTSYPSLVDGRSRGQFFPGISGLTA